MAGLALTGKGLLARRLGQLAEAETFLANPDDLPCREPAAGARSCWRRSGTSPIWPATPGPVRLVTARPSCWPTPTATPGAWRWPWRAWPPPPPSRGTGPRQRACLGVASRLRDTHGGPVVPSARGDVDRAVDRAMVLLGEAGFAAAYADGRAADLADVLAEQLISG